MKRFAFRLAVLATLVAAAAPALAGGGHHHHGGAVSFSFFGGFPAPYPVYRPYYPPPLYYPAAVYPVYAPYPAPYYAYPAPVMVAPPPPVGVSVSVGR